MPNSSDLYLQVRIEAYTYSSLILGPLASTSAAILIMCECVTSSQRIFHERLSFHAVAASEIIAGWMQLMFGIMYFRMLKYQETGLELFSEVVNAIYMVAIIFCTATILQVSFCRWVHISGVRRVREIRPLSNTDWFIIWAFTGIAAVVVLLNKVAYVLLNADKQSTMLQNCHTISIMLILTLWLIIFIALLYYNICLLKISRQIQKRPVQTTAQPPDPIEGPVRMEMLVKHPLTRRPLAPQQTSVLNLSMSVLSVLHLSDTCIEAVLNPIWLRMVLVIYNFASILFVLKVADYIYLSQASQTPWLSYPSEMHIVATVNHILQTAAILVLPIVWLMFCTHLIIDFKRRNQKESRRASSASIL